MTDVVQAPTLINVSAPVPQVVTQVLPEQVAVRILETSQVETEKVEHIVIQEERAGVSIIAVGAQGPAGTGSVGPQGPQGTIGVDGEDGTDGMPGPMGPQGTQGPQGNTGANGSIGPQGAMGPVGDQGEQGEEGMPVPGPVGPTGATGAQGVIGPQGVIGSTGLDGEEGPEGMPVPGPVGPTGATGVQGVTGAQGPLGPVGSDGESGEEGMPVPGPVGPTGATGNTGAIGPQGTMGVPGVDGESGEESGGSSNRLPTLSGDVTASGTGGGVLVTVIANNAVTNAKVLDNTLGLQKISQIATLSFLGRLSALTGNVENLTAALARNVLALVLTGDVTGTDNGTTFVTAIANAAVTLAKMENRATQTFIGRSTAGTGVPEELSIATAKTMLNLTGTNSGDQTITLTGDVTGSGAGSFAATIATNAVTTTKIAANTITNNKLTTVATQTFKARNSVGTGDPEDVSIATAKTMLGITQFTSTDQTITAGGALTIAHGLGATPTRAWIALVCQTGELGYTAGDVVHTTSFENNDASAVNRGYIIVVDGANLNVRFGSATNSVFSLLNKGTGTGALATNGNWKVRFFAIL